MPPTSSREELEKDLEKIKNTLSKEEKISILKQMNSASPVCLPDAHLGTSL